MEVRTRERERELKFLLHSVFPLARCFFFLYAIFLRGEKVFFSRARAGFSRFTVVDSVEIWNGLCKRGLEIKNSKSWLSKTGVSINTPRIHTSSPSLKDGD